MIHTGPTQKRKKLDELREKEGVDPGIAYSFFFYFLFLISISKFQLQFNFGFIFEFPT